MILPTDKQARKNAPMARGLLDYFPLALAAVAELSRVANEQHNPGEPLHWAREKSSDHADCAIRHLVDRGKIDTDGQRHTTKAAWRLLAELQIELENAAKEAAQAQSASPSCSCRPPVRRYGTCGCAVCGGALSAPANNRRRLCDCGKQPGYRLCDCSRGFVNHG